MSRHLKSTSTTVMLTLWRRIISRAKMHWELTECWAWRCHMCSASMNSCSCQKQPWLVLILALFDKQGTKAHRCGENDPWSPSCYVGSWDSSPGSLRPGTAPNRCSASPPVQGPYLVQGPWLNEDNNLGFFQLMTAQLINLIIVPKWYA